MRVNKLFKRQKSEKGSGRTVKVKHILLPEEVVDDLKLYKDCYEMCLSNKKDENGYTIPIRVTYEQMFRRWMENIGRIDPDVVKMFDYLKKCKKEEQTRHAKRLGLTLEQLEANHAAFDPTDPENKPWKLRYIFYKDGEKTEALPGVYTPFYAKINSQNVGMKNMLIDGWSLMNEIGDELDFEQAVKICALIKEHQEKQI